MRRAGMPAIDLGCDLGEGGPHDAELMPLVSSAHVACGGHAGTATTMADTVVLARRHGVAIGAHPGHVDRESFGRHELPIEPRDAAALVFDQVAALVAVSGEPPHHVKLHGGLYHQVGRGGPLGEAVVAAILAGWPRTVLVACAGSRIATIARARGLSVAEEAFVDRAYAPDGSLLPRSQPGAEIVDPRAAAERAMRLVREGVLEAIDGSLLPIRADTLCIHGDAANAVATAAAVREALVRAGVVIAPPAAADRPPSPRAGFGMDDAR